MRAFASEEVVSAAVLTPSLFSWSKNRGCRVLAVCTSHTRERMEQTEADWVCDDLTCVRVKKVEDAWEVFFDTQVKLP